MTRDGRNNEIDMIDSEETASLNRLESQRKRRIRRTLAIVCAIHSIFFIVIAVDAAFGSGDITKRTNWLLMGSFLSLLFFKFAWYLWRRK